MALESFPGGRPVSKLIPLLVGATGLSEHDIFRIVRNAPARYKTYLIEKRDGGTREISQPAREVKALQRALIADVLKKLPVHPSATAYRSGASIRDNAAAHAASGTILKFDFKNFFPSIVTRDWVTYCEQKELFTSQIDIYLSTQVLFRQRSRSSVLRLAIGAPSSPILSNVLMAGFDARIAERVNADHVTYTRYADDLTFSARRNGYLRGVERALRQTIREIKSPSLTINESKTVLATQKYKRMVTGLILTNVGNVSLGRDRKGNIRATLHHAEQGKLTTVERAHLAGLLAFVQDVEPEFFARLVRHYGSALIADVKAACKAL